MDFLIITYVSAEAIPSDLAVSSMQGKDQNVNAIIPYLISTGHSSKLAGGLTRLSAQILHTS